MTDTIPDHVGREAVRLLNEGMSAPNWFWPKDRNTSAVITVAKLLMNPPAPMTDPDEEAAWRVVEAGAGYPGERSSVNLERMARATDQMRKEREAWEAGR